MDIHELKRYIREDSDIEVGLVADETGGFYCQIRGRGVYSWLSRTGSESPMTFYDVSEAKDYIGAKLEATRLVIPADLSESGSQPRFH